MNKEVTNKQELVEALNNNANACWIKYEADNLRYGIPDLFEVENLEDVDFYQTKDGKLRQFDETIENLEDVASCMVQFDLAYENNYNIWESVEVVMVEGDILAR